MRLGLAMLRFIVGSLFMGHGLQKLAGWFGGAGVKGTGDQFEAMGLRPGKAHATAAGAGETVGGALLAGGLLTPLGAALLSGTMITAIRTVHGSRGPWVTKGGYEYNLVLLAALFAIADAGPGGFSLDEALGIRRSGLRWAIAQLAAGAIGSTVALQLAREPQPGEGEAPAGAADSGADRREREEQQEPAARQPAGAGELARSDGHPLRA